MKTSVIRVHFRDVQVDMAYPDTGNAGQHLQNILSGRDYPLLDAPFEPDCIVDVGANVGATALFFAARYPSADIYSFEASPSNFEYLRHNTEAFATIHAFDFGLFDEDGEARLYLGASQCLQNSIHPSIEVREDFETIRLRKASAALSGVLQGRCILKIDTEGCETQILHDLGALLGAVDLLYLEYHSERDRRSIDRLLSPQFKLWHSHSEMVHRGNLAYVSERLLAEVPGLEQWEVKAGATVD